VFAAWQTWAGQLPQTGKPWSEKHLNGQLRKKGLKQPKKSSNMKWLDIALRFDAEAFCEEQDGRLRPVERDLPTHAIRRRGAGAVGLHRGRHRTMMKRRSPEPPSEAEDDDDIPWP
jgi:hypothetical protein